MWAKSLLSVGDRGSSGTGWSSGLTVFKKWSNKSSPHLLPPSPLSVELARIQSSSKGGSLGAQKRFLKDHVQRSTDKQLILCTYGSKRSCSHPPSPPQIPPAKVESRQWSPHLRMFQPLILISKTKDLYHLIEHTKSNTHTHTQG